MRAVHLVGAFVFVAACGGGGATPRREPPPQHVVPPTPEVSAASRAVAERERACEEHVRVMEAFGECPVYLNGPDQMRADIEEQRASWASSDSSSVAWQELLRDGCFQSSAAVVDAAGAFGCAVPETPELNAWRARPFEPPLASPEDECLRADQIIEVFDACTNLSADAAKAAAVAVQMVESSKLQATYEAIDRHAAAARCRYTGVGLSKLATEASCAGF